MVAGRPDPGGPGVPVPPRPPGRRDHGRGQACAQRRRKPARDARGPGAGQPGINPKFSDLFTFGGLWPTIVYWQKIPGPGDTARRQVRQCRETAALSGESSAEGADHVWRILLTLAGMLIAIAGVVWTLQGLGFIKGSVMTGVMLWVLIGPLIALCGLAVTVTGLRRS